MEGVVLGDEDAGGGAVEKHGEESVVSWG
jgi:hypothetical protein